MVWKVPPELRKRTLGWNCPGLILQPNSEGEGVGSRKRGAQYFYL